jgi:hypothetical protein
LPRLKVVQFDGFGVDAHVNGLRSNWAQGQLLDLSAIALAGTK